MKRKIFLIALFTLFFIQISMSGVIAKSSQEDAQKELKYEVTVTLKLIQVYVTDKMGNPVTDLSLTDFELYDNGKPVKITDFEKHILFKPEKKAWEKPAPPETPSRMNRKLFFFLDLAFNSNAGITKSTKAALHFIDTQLHSTDEVGILTYTGWKGLTLHEYLTTDHQKVRQVIEEIGAKKVLGRAQNAEGKYWFELASTVTPVGELKGGKGGLAAAEFSRMYRQVVGFDRKVYIHQASDFYSVVREAAKAFRYIPGVKHFILFSGGVAGFTSASAEIQAQFGTMTKELAASNSPVYAVNTEGASALLKERGMRGDQSLRRLADFTGGKYFANVLNYEKVMEEIQNLTSAYYVLGYSIDEEWDGKYHEVKVKVKRKGCKVFGQGGYFNPKPFTKYTKMEKMLHLIDMALSDKSQFQDPLYFPLLVQPYSIRDKANVVTLTKIPKEKLEDILGGKIEIISFFFDKDNTITEFIEKDVEASEFEQGNIYYYSLCALPPSDYNCRVVIRNLETGMGAVASSQITIPEETESGFRLFPPLLLIPGKDDLYLKGSSKEKKYRDIALTGIYPFSPSDYSPMIEELDQKVSKILAVVRCMNSSIKEPEIRLSGQLVHSTSGRKTPLSLSVLNQYREQNTEVFVIEIALGEVNPGRYLLELSADEMKTDAKSHTQRIFIVN